jgi:ubiquinone/menaquinone biosynthesis C-methylase UbiE
MINVDSNDRIRRIWDRYAPRYDKEIRFWERVMFAGGREWVCTQAAGETLEVAVGTGLNLPFYPAEVTLTGVDLSPAMLAVARERAAGLGRVVSLREANAEQLPFDDGSFDTIVCTLALCSIPNDRAAIAQMYRVLRPGGRLLLLDHVAAPNPLLRAGQRLFEVVTSRIAADYQTRRPLPMLQQAGFDIETSQRSRAGTVERLRALKPPTATITAMDGPPATG